MTEISIDDALSAFEDSQRSLQASLEYYEAAERDMAVGIATPPQLRVLLAQVGIPRLYVDALADRLVVEGFRLGDESGTSAELWSWWQANALDVESTLGHVDALVYGRAYITVAAPDEHDPGIDDPTVPIIKVESPTTLYAKVNPLTRKPDWAVRVIREDNEVVGATLYTPNTTVVYETVDGGMTPVHTVTHNLGVVPVVPIIHRNRVSDTAGSSAITAELRSITDAMSRLLMNLQVTSELMATPQRVLFGTTRDELVGEDSSSQSGLELYISSYLSIEDPDGSAFQFPAAELRNFADGMATMLKLAASYTGLPPQYLLVSDENPASAEAIKASEARLVRKCEALSTVFGEAWEQAMRVAMLVMGRPLTIAEYRMETIWRDPSTPTYQAKADAAVKLYNGGNGIIPKEQARLDMGYPAEAIRQMELWDKNSPEAQALALYGQLGEVSAYSGRDVGAAEQSDGADAAAASTPAA